MSVSIKSRDTVFQSLRFEQPATCPYYIWVDKRMVPALAERYGAGMFVGPADGTRTFAGSYTAWTEILALPVEDHGDWFVDEFGAVIRRGEALAVERPALSEPCLKGYRFPDLASGAHFKGIDEWATLHRDRFRIVQLGMLFWERTWFMRGMENILMDFVLNPAFVDELLDGLEEICSRAIDRLLRDHAGRIDAIGFSEDYGTQRSLLMSPAHWRRFIRPRLSRLVEQVHRGGKKFYLHSCGHVGPLVPEFIDIGVDMLQPLQPEANDIFALKRQFGRHLCLMGGVSTQQTLPHGTPDDVRREVRMCLDMMAGGGGYVMAPAKPILPGVPIENSVALIEAFMDRG
ncbi:MAG TPA: uroporphyrinogen decarboxylase family protein [Phycisphaerae bacterium]|nr:uroporphyrinogen decarboxylase family protein [Phycisphaerae bacterium]